MEISRRGSHLAGHSKAPPLWGAENVPRRPRERSSGVCAHLGPRPFWARSLDFTEKYVRSCPSCQARNAPTKKPAGPIQSFCPERPFEMLAMDVMGPLLRTKSGNIFIITCIDLFTKWVVAKALPAQNALSVTKFVLFDVFLTFSMPIENFDGPGHPLCQRLYYRTLSVDEREACEDERVPARNERLLRALQQDTRSHVVQVHWRRAEDMGWSTLVCRVRFWHECARYNRGVAAAKLAIVPIMLSSFSRSQFNALDRSCFLVRLYIARCPWRLRDLVILEFLDVVCLSFFSLSPISYVTFVTVVKINKPTKSDRLIAWFVFSQFLLDLDEFACRLARV